ncbi:MAG: hypothetical protein MJ157_00335 [Clostridia bacterium]|nr:hypothetical protein [Clostridia bacterium]
MLKQMETVSKTIAGYVFYLRPLPAFRAVNLLGEFAACFGPLAASLLPWLQKENWDWAEFSGAWRNLSGEQIENLLDKLLIQPGNLAVEMENEPHKLSRDFLNETFCGELTGLLQLVIEVLKLNYQSFFGKVGDLFGKETA